MSKKEERVSRKELAEKDREIHQLRRQVSRLQKQLAKVLTFKEELTEEDTSLVKSASAATCPKCDAHGLVTVNLPLNKVLMACKACSWRKVE